MKQKRHEILKKKILLNIYNKKIIINNLLIILKILNL